MHRLLDLDGVLLSLISVISGQRGTGFPRLDRFGLGVPYGMTRLWEQVPAAGRLLTFQRKAFLAYEVNEYNYPPGGRWHL